MGKKILVTGAAGSIGREILKQLSQSGNDVVGVDNCSRFPNFKTKYTFYKQDLIQFLSDNENVYDEIYHMAAINGTASFYSRPNEVLRNNTNLDLEIFSYVESNQNCKLIYASSSEVVANTENFPTKEEVDITIKNIHNPRWSYRLPKILSENYLMNSDIDFLIIRFFNIVGEHSGKGHFIKDIINKIEHKDYSIIGGNETRSFCHVDDAVDALLKLKNISGEVINIGSNEEILIKDAVSIISTELEIDEEWSEVGSLEGSADRRCPDISKLRSYIEFCPINFKQIIEKLFNFLK